jgi:glycosyltransferase involved in cell wall biosynthesis
MPKVSVIIPAYNVMAYLPETLDSVLKQTFVDFEVIIVNDGSSDGIEAWAEQLTDPRVKFFSQKNQGPSVARNTGLDQAQGNYIAFLDADDLWDSSKLEKQVQVLDNNLEVGLVYTWVASIDQNGRSRGRILEHHQEGNVWKALLKHNILECGSTPMVRRNCLQTVGNFDLNLPNSQDRDMWIRIASQYKFAVIKEPLVSYRQRTGSVSKRWEVVERCSHLILEKAFAAPPADVTPSELQQIKNLSYGLTYLRLAWKPLQVQRDIQTTIRLQNQALSYCSQLRFSKENIRLSIAIVLAKWLGPEQYDGFLTFLYSIRRTLSRVKQKTS